MKCKLSAIIVCLALMHLGAFGQKPVENILLNFDKKTSAHSCQAAWIGNKKMYKKEIC